MTSRKKCWVPTCANIAGRDNKKYSFLPGNSQMRELWIAVSGKTTESIPAEDILFCEEHFPEEDILKCKTSLVPCKNMPDRMCRTCMCIIPAENSFHVISSKFTSEMPPSIKDTLFFWITSKPEPLQQIFSFCIPELKIPRDPIQIICNDCFHNIWLFFVFKITCIEVEKDLKGDMSWANYGKKVLCRSCIQTSGTNFIPLTAQSNMGNLLQKMFVNDCPPPEIVPLQVCLICFNVLEKLDHFYKNCLEVEEKMSRHIALKKKYEHRDMKELPSTTIQKFLPIQHINNCPPHYANESMNYSNLPKNYVASIPNNKQILAQLMLRYGLPLRKDLYQQEVWSLICQKMQEQSIACNVPGLMNVWKEMEKETKRKFELKERPQYIDKLVMEFYNIVPSYTNTESLREYHISKSVDKGNATSIIQGITISKNRVENLIQEEDNEKEIPLLVEETDDNQNKKVLPTKSDSSSKATSKTDDKTFSHHQRSWTDEKKMEFLKVIEDEYKIHSSTRKQSEISLARGPWRSICFRLAEHRYKEYEGLFLYQMWIAIKKRAIEEENQETVSPVSKMALTMLNAELAICKKLGRNVSTKRVLKSKFKLRTDQKALVALFGENRCKLKMSANLMQRWALFLSSFDYTIEHIKGEDNPVAETVTISEEAPGRATYVYFTESVSNWHINNEKKVEDGKGTKKRTSHQKRQELHIDHGLVMWGHRIAYCDTQKPETTNPRGNSFRSFWDKQIKWVEVIEMKHTTVFETERVLRDIFSRLGLSHVCVSDNGPLLVARELEVFLKKNGIKHITSSPYHPQSNGKVDRRIFNGSRKPQHPENINNLTEDRNLSSLHTVLDRKDELNITGSGNSKKKQAEFKKITRNSVKNAEGSKKNVKDDCVMKNPEEPEEKPIKETATPPDYDQSTVVAIKKRSSKEIPSSSKKPRTAHRSFSEEEKLQLVKLISDVYENMPKDELLGIASWPAVIKRIIENGGFKDYTGDEIDSVWCQMRLTASRRKHIGSSGALDNKVYKLMALAAKNRAYTRMKSKKNTTPSKKQYEKDRAYCPNRFLNVGTGNINKSSVELRHEIKSHHPKVTLEDYEIEDETTERNSPGRNWSRSEKIGLISAVRSHGNIFKQNQDHLWLKIHQEYEEKGFKRPLATIKTYWYSLLKHAEMVWANQKERNEIDNILISFMENSTNVLNNISETNTTDGDNPVNNLDEEEEKASCIDLTYDYVSFKDIEKLAWETAEVKTPLKTEQKEKEDDEETIIDFVMAKVEGGVQYDSGDSVQDESVPESTELLDSSTCQEKGDTQEKRDKSEDRVENEETPKKTSAPVDEVSEESNSLQKNVKKEKRTLAESDEIIEINSDSE
ncbi:hypothetical protein JTB14_028498 [Gonioctena quinquepunctata]|nr:hypothetical protein JTB14_028498 [Gonioctena quinquepunctata]